jgi:hypothetical protein
VQSCLLVYVQDTNESLSSLEFGKLFWLADKQLIKRDVAVLMCVCVGWMCVCLYLMYGCVHKIDLEVSLKEGLVITIVPVYVNLLKHMGCYLCHML